MLTIERHILSLGRNRIAYETTGSGEPLVLLHGLSGSSRWWRRNVEALGKRFRLYLIDLIGYGGSRGQRFFLSQASVMIYEMLDALKLERVNLMGHSMGGYISAELAASHPDRVDRLVLVDALALPVGRSVIRSALGLVEGVRYMPASFFPVLVTDAMRAGPLILLRTTLDIHKADLRANLSKIEARTLIIWGEKDTLLPLNLGQGLHEALPKAEFVVLPGAGHNAMWDKPEAFNQAALAFLEKS